MWQHVWRGLSAAVYAVLRPAIVLPKDDSVHAEAIKSKPAMLRLALMTRIESNAYDHPEAHNRPQHCTERHDELLQGGSP